ncbi:hypothetical protein DSM106972_001270 [Dulcicalothrix desertica PCC 7102]|uniref:Tetratricopeptide repeat protein n=1 Tax=Dulcicalothrix desertica PCC 7102 TaxID=232991 RepID=A0A433VUG2_9CYAN|nr:tetratricopeptide repeat protein [Dulcicalothrix desertica]RUT09632.1 hypothetical protein DSM106972_001270 [Dulcicalothrix desertica PCC 7102]TWH50829.1 hypothetical protein CAL7102_05175 [Dulcicalothrix desertica PCC 7102]
MPTPQENFKYFIFGYDVHPTKAINIQEKLGADTELIIILENLASLYKSQGKYSEAESIHTRISELTKQATDDKRM